MSALLLVLLLAGGIDEDLREDIRYGWRGPVQDAVAYGLDVTLDWPPALAASMALGLTGDKYLTRTALQGGASWAGASAVLFGLRAVVRRPRPELHDSDWWQTAFPSGHTTTYFSLATVYAVRYPGLRWPLTAVGVLVGLSRVYQGEHYPSDVLAGAALGVGAGLLTCAVWPDGPGSGSPGRQISLVPSGSGVVLRVGF